MNTDDGCPGALLDRGSGYIAVECLSNVSPNSSLGAFEDFLARVGECVRRYFPRQVLVLGDFNAHSSQ